MTSRQRKTALRRFYAVLSPDHSVGGARCQEPELVVEALILETVLSDRNSCLLLQSLGLKVEPSLLSDLESDINVSNELMNEILVQGRNASLRWLSVEHAAKVADKLELDVDHHGSVGRLMTAIRSATS